MAGLAITLTAIDRALEQVGLGAERNDRVRGFSAGMRRRLALGRLLLRPATLLLLDEPYAAFDARHRLWTSSTSLRQRTITYHGRAGDRS